LEKGDSKDQIYLTDSEGSFHKNLTNDNHHNIYPSWTHDGRIIYTRDKGELMVMNSDGTGKEQFLDIPVGQVRMSPNGRFLLVSKNDGNLYTIDLSNNNEKLVINGLQL